MLSVSACKKVSFMAMTPYLGSLNAKVKVEPSKGIDSNSI